MTWSLAALIRRGAVEEYAFKVLLREVMLLVSFFLVTGSAAFGLALAWRRKRRREEDDAASSVDATSPPFFICVITLTMAISIAIALPATLVVLHEVGQASLVLRL